MNLNWQHCEIRIDCRQIGVRSLNEKPRFGFGKEEVGVRKSEWITIRQGFKDRLTIQSKAWAKKIQKSKFEAKIQIHLHISYIQKLLVLDIADFVWVFRVWGGVTVLFKEAFALTAICILKTMRWLNITTWLNIFKKQKKKKKLMDSVISLSNLPCLYIYWCKIFFILSLKIWRRVLHKYKRFFQEKRAS